MEVNVESAGTSSAKILFTVSAEEFEQEVEGELRQVGKRMRMKGFRPGKVPAHVIEKQFGEQVRRDVAQLFLRKAYQQALSDGDLDPISHPRVASEELAPGEDGSLSLSFEVPLRPRFELPSYEGMTIESERDSVLDEQVEAVLEDLRRQESVPQPAGEEGIGEDGLVVADVTFLHEGEPVLEREGLRLGAHNPPPGVDPQSFAEALLGARDGAQLEVEVTLSPSIEKEQARGEQGTCRIVVREAFDMVPPSEEALLAKLEASDAEDMRAKLRARLEEAAERRERARVENVLLERVIREADPQLPESLVDEQTESRLHQLHEQMEQQGVPHDKIHEQIDEQRATARAEAQRGLAALLVVEAIGEQADLLVGEEEIDHELGKIAERNEAALEEVRQYYVENNLTQQLAIELLERKVRTYLREKAEIKTPS